MFLFGAVLGLISLELADGRMARPTPFGVACLVALIVAAGLLVAGHRLPGWAFHPLLATGSAIIVYAAVLAGPGTIPLAYAMVFVWVALYAGYFFSLLATAGHVLASVVAFGTVLIRHEQPVSVEVVVLLGVCGLVGGVANWLSHGRVLSHVDPLTGVANRRGLDRVLRSAMDEAGFSGTSLTVGLLDVDGFRGVNEVGGHAAGDRLLVDCVQSWNTRLPTGAFLARLDGDTFAMVLPGHELRKAHDVLDALRAAVPPPHTCSVGITAWSPGDTQSLLLARADAALYRAKRDGRNRIHVLGDDLEIATHLRAAIDAGELRLDYQPIHDLTGGRLVAVEALVRWHHPDRGVLPPGEFIPAAERTGAIHALGRWIVLTACEQLHHWRTTVPAGVDLSVAINISAAQLGHHWLVDDLRRALERFRLPASSVIIELTEGALADDDVPVLQAFRELRALGVRVAMDDFGAGHSSLGRLRQLPFDILKIDRSFLADAGPQGDLLLQAIVEVATRLGLETVAEGVEQPFQLRQVAAFGCTCAQGFLLGRPQPASGIEALLAAGGRAPVALLDVAPPRATVALTASRAPVVVPKGLSTPWS